jgi:hypothetical protein
VYQPNEGLGVALLSAMFLREAFPLAAADADVEIAALTEWTLLRVKLAVLDFTVDTKPCVPLDVVNLVIRVPIFAIAIP